ncbi:hypothetical protein [Chryseolinea lacunae]|uniref:Outer membrane protein beta-barrel domain-containing protein n=1 Tax=Chryseolinea lacunae TaxID=2801331 RepID=A0ABS1KUR6_9BACT|nr:hypothetical protein [Chryseolinea lacunae]MBL0743090.1 hypothetical protein [Chryseolinea lacunae]
MLEKIRSIFELEVFTVFFVFLLTTSAYSQDFTISLSPRHQKKLNATRNGHSRLVRYYKYYRRDSSRFVHDQERSYKRRLDSTFKAESKQRHLQKKLARKGMIRPQVSGSDSLSTELNRWYSFLRDSSTTDSIRQRANIKVRELAVQKAKQYPGFQNLLEKYQISKDTADWKELAKHAPGFDTLSSVFNSSPEQVFKLAEKQSEKYANALGSKALGGGISEARALEGMTDQYKQQYEQYTNPEQLKEKGKAEAARQAVDHFANHTKELQGAQQKVSKILAKYKEFSDSNDLSTAVKRTSMQGKSFKEHLLIGGNFNVVSTQPFSLDFSPQVGYKFTTNFSVGVGMNYRFTYSDSIKSSSYVSPSNTSYKAFIHYDFFKSFFLYGEFERSGIKASGNDKSRKTWQNNCFVGLGRKFLVHPKLYLTLTALYNLNNSNNNPVHPRRFQVRVGFQLSELAIRKKKIFYDPNR